MNMRNSCRPPDLLGVFPLVLVALTAASAPAGDPPVILVHPVSAADCAGEQVTFSVVASGADLTYEWRRDGDSISLQDTPDLVLEAITVDDAGAYDVIVRNSFGFDTSDPATLTVDTGPVIGVHPVGQIVCEDAVATLSVEATGINLEYIWLKDGHQMSGQTAATLVFSPVTLADIGSYEVLVRNDCGQQLSDSAALDVTELPAILGQPTDRTVCSGTDVTFAVVAVGDDLSYQWYKGVSILPGATGDTLLLAAVTSDDSGDYHVVVANSCGNATSESATLIADPGPEIITQPESAEVCEGDDVTLSVTLDNPGTVFVDTVGATGSSSSGMYLRGNYFRVDTGRTLTRIEQYLTITTSGTLVFFIYEADNQSGPYSLALEETVTESGVGQRYFSSNALSFQLQAGKYYLIGAGSPTAKTYYWGSNHGAKTFGASFNGFSDIWPSDGVLPDPARSTFLTWAYAQRLTTSDVALSYRWRKDDADLPGGAGPEYTIESMAAADVGDYDVVIISDCGDLVSDTATVTLGQAATIWQQPVSRTACVDGAVTFTVGATGSGLSYQWRKSGVDIPDATSPGYTISPVTLDDVGSYDVVISNPCQVVSTSATLGVSETSPTITEHPADVAACADDRVTFTVNADGSYLHYQWYKDAVEIPDATASSYVISSVDPTDVGEYFVEVSNDCGTVTSDSAALTVESTVTIDEQPQGGEICVGVSYSLTVLATGNDLAYQWYKDGEEIVDATGAAYVIDPAAHEDTGDYHVVISNDCGDFPSDTVTLTVYEGPVITDQPLGQTLFVGDPLLLSVGIDFASFPDYVDTVGDPLSSNSGSNKIRGNVYAVDQTVTLTRIEQYLNITASGPLKFFVYESDDGDLDPFELILESTVTQSGTGSRYFASQPLEQTLEAGKHYLIGAAWTGSHTYYWEPDAHPVTTTFGQTVVGYASSYFGSWPYQPSPTSPHVWSQRLTTVRPIISYQWTKDGADIAGATGESYAVPAVTFRHGGVYRVDLTNACGTVSSDAANISVRASITPGGANVVELGGSDQAGADQIPPAP